MPRNHDDDDDEGPQEIDRAWAAARDENDDDDDTQACVQCGFAMHALATKCPKCGAWKMWDSPAARRGRSWGVSLVIAMLIATILVMWVGLR